MWGEWEGEGGPGDICGVEADPLQHNEGTRFAFANEKKGGRVRSERWSAIRMLAASDACKNQIYANAKSRCSPNVAFWEY